MKVFLISDTHFGHKNIINYENRPFENIKEMNDSLIKNWNSIVKKEDKIFHLGDFVFGNKDYANSIISQLNGDIYLIKGNHDNHSNNWYLDLGIKQVYNYPILYSEFYLLSHQPIYINENTPFINIHGHLHSNSYISKGYKKQNGHYNVSVEVIDYKPIEFKIIKNKYNFEGVKNDKERNF